MREGNIHHLPPAGPSGSNRNLGMCCLGMELQPSGARGDAQPTKPQWPEYLFYQK